MVSNKKQRAFLCAALVGLGNAAYARSMDDFFNDLFGTSFESTAPEQKQTWSDVQKEIEATTPHLHEITYLLDQMHAKKRENLAATLASIESTQQQLENVKTRLERHISTSNDFDIQEEQTAGALTVHIATPGFDSKNITVVVNAEEKTLFLNASRVASNTFNYSSTEFNNSTGRQSTINYENGTLDVTITLSENIDYHNHTVEFEDDEIIVTFPFSKKQESTKSDSHEHLEHSDDSPSTDKNNSKEDDEEGDDEEESE